MRDTKTSLHILMLTSFALARPIYELLANNPELLVAHRAQMRDLMFLVLVVSVGVPLGLIAVERLASALSSEIGDRIHHLFVAFLLGLIALPVLEWMGLGIWPEIVLAAALALAIAFAYARLPILRTYFTVLSPAVLLFPALFLADSGVRKAVDPGEERTTDRTEITSTSPIVMVIFDELSGPSLMDTSLEINALRYPSFAKLARSSYWFRNATTVAQSTGFAVPAIVTGRYPEGARPPTLSEYPQNLFTLLGGSYDLVATENLTWLCPWRMCSSWLMRRPYAVRGREFLSDVAIVYLHLVLPGAWTAKLPSVTATARDFAFLPHAVRGTDTRHTLPKAACEFEDFLSGIEARTDSTLYYVHLKLPHLPWVFMPSGRHYGPVARRVHGDVGDTWSADAWEVVQGYQRYLLQLVYTDRVLGRLMAKLEEVGLYDDALIVVVADHGISFAASGDRRRISRQNLADIVNVPLIVKLPHQDKGVVDDRNIETIDILPTVADVLGIDLPWSTDGQSTLDPALPPRPVKRVYKTITDKVENIELVTFRNEDLQIREKTIAWKLAIFGSGDDPGSIFRIGPHVAIHGRQVDALHIVSPAKPIAVALDRPEVFEDVRPDGIFIPTYISGRMRSPLLREEPIELAVVINGTVRATTQTYDREPGRARFTAMVPEDSFEPGLNRVEIFVIRGKRNRVRLIPTRRLVR